MAIGIAHPHRRFVLALALAAPAAFAAPADAGPSAVRIACIGDSITQAMAPRWSYRYPLWKLLLDAGVTVDMVGSVRDNARRTRSNYPRHLGREFDRDHEGHWGWRADEVLRRLPRWLEGYVPDIALIHLGTNDVFRGEDNASTVQELAHIIDALRARSPTVIVLLAQIIPSADPAANERIADLNRRLPALAQATRSAASPVIVVDLFSDYDGVRDNYDGVHPNAVGEAKMAQRWFDALRPVLP